LPQASEQAENGCVQFRKPFAVLFAVLLIPPLAVNLRAVRGPAQSYTPQAAPKSISAPPPAARIDINHASIEDLLKVPGMTPSWAGRIVRFRPYRTKADLLEHGVLPSDVYDRIKDSIIAHRAQQ
jgi:competence protein ComEA